MAQQPVETGSVCVVTAKSRQSVQRKMANNRHDNEKQGNVLVDVDIGVEIAGDNTTNRVWTATLEYWPRDQIPPGHLWSEDEREQDECDGEGVCQPSTGTGAH